MTILSEQRIIQKLNSGELDIEPFSRESLQPASYDLRAAQKTEIKNHTLLHTKENVEFSKNIAGIVRMRSSLAREGIFFSGGYIDPGYKGNITLSLANLSEEPVTLEEGEGVANLVFFRVEGETSGYSGKYQGSIGKVDSKRK
ncbi:dCTP deaminase [archaeon SCG-AAA382B04]|nr:dCTP deaminase [archaeon SCG-AAA382B04]